MRKTVQWMKIQKRQKGQTGKVKNGVTKILKVEFCSRIDWKGRV